MRNPAVKKRHIFKFSCTFLARLFLFVNNSNLFETRSAGSAGRVGRGGFPLINVWSSANGSVIDVELPGVDPKDVDISVADDELILKGKISGREHAEGEKYSLRERPAGSFVRTIRLPYRVDTKSVQAHYKNGLLRLTISAI